MSFSFPNVRGVGSLKELGYLPEKYLVAWDFAKKPSGTFYRILHDEFGSLHSNGDVSLIQRSVAICRDDFTASRLAELADHFGAKVVCFAAGREGIPRDDKGEAREFISRVLQQRLKRRGRRKS